MERRLATSTSGGFAVYVLVTLYVWIRQRATSIAAIERDAEDTVAAMGGDDLGAAARSIWKLHSQHNTGALQVFALSAVAFLTVVMLATTVFRSLCLMTYRHPIDTMAFRLLFGWMTSGRVLFAVLRGTTLATGAGLLLAIAAKLCQVQVGRPRLSRNPGAHELVVQFPARMLAFWIRSLFISARRTELPERLFAELALVAHLGAMLIPVALAFSEGDLATWSCSENAERLMTGAAVATLTLILAPVLAVLSVN